MPSHTVSGIVEGWCMVIGTGISGQEYGCAVLSLLWLIRKAIAHWYKLLLLCGLSSSQSTTQAGSSANQQPVGLKYLIWARLLDLGGNPQVEW